MQWSFRIPKALLNSAQSEDGQGLTEYGLILALVTLVAIFSLTGPAGKISGMIQSVGDSLTTVS